MRCGSKGLKEDFEDCRQNEKKNDCTIEEMALRGIVTASCTTKNFVLFPPDNLPSHSVQYDKLLEFIEAASEPFKTQLTHIIYPMFVQMYIELITSDKKYEAQQFFRKHSISFEQSEGYKNVVDDLIKVSSLEDVKNHNYFKLFREDKYVIELSEECKDYLLLYLKDTNYVTMLHLLNLYFSLECEGIESDHILEMSSSPQKRPCQTTEVSPSNNVSSDCTMQSPLCASLKDAINQLKDGPPSIPSIAMYNISSNVWRCSSMSFSPTSALIAGGFEESVIQLWNLLSEGVYAPNLWTFPEDYDIGEKRQVKFLRGHGGPVYGMSFTPDGEHLLSCSSDTTVRMWSLKNFENIGTYSGHAYPIWDIDVSPLSLYFATASFDKTGRLWAIDRLYPLHIFIGHRSDVDCIKFHPNCNYLATGSKDETVRLWNVQDGHMVRLFTGHRGCIHCLAFSPDGQYLASAGEDEKIKIWDLRSGLLLKELMGHTDSIHSLNFNETGTLLASGGKDQCIKFWDTKKILSTSTSIETMSENGLAEVTHSPEFITSIAVESSVYLTSFGLKDLLFAVGVS